MLGAPGRLTLSILLAGSTVTSAKDYGSLAAAAAEKFSPVGDDDLAVARTLLADAVVNVERLLDPASDEGAAWLEYLRWDGIQSQLGRGTTPDLAAANATLRRLKGGADGLERAELQALAEAIEGYTGVARFAVAAEERQRRSFAAAASRVVELLERNPSDARSTFQAERRLGLLAGIESTGNGVALLSAIRDDFGAPNVLVGVDAALLERLVGRSVDDCAPVTDCILGTSIRGTGATTGRLGVRPLDAAGQARLLFTLSGTTHSQTVGLNGPAVIRSTGVTNFTASKVVTLTDDSFHLSPAAADATTRSTTRSVSKQGGGIGSMLVERIGARRVAQSKHKADAIAADHAEDRIAAQLDRQLAEAVVDARRRYDDRIRKPLRRRRATPRALVMRTSSAGLHVESTFANPGQLAAPSGEAPTAAAGTVRVRLHQTAVNNLLDAYLAGVTIRRDSVEEPARMDVVTPPWLKLKADEPLDGERFRPWSIRLREPRPVSVQFEAGRITVILHAAEFRVEDSAYEGWDLIAKLEPVREESGWRLIRRGPIEVFPTRFDPTGPGRLKSSEVGLRNNLAKALNEPEDRLPLEVDIDPIDLSEREGPIDLLSMTALAVEGGWLSAGWVAP